MTAWIARVLDAVRKVLSPATREWWYRLVSGGLTLLLTFGVLDADKAALWTQLGLGTVTLVFASLYSTSTWRTALYALVGPAGAVLMAYGIVGDVQWALITAAVAQLFGVATAAAKTVQAPAPAA